MTLFTSSSLAQKKKKEWRWRQKTEYCEVLLFLS